ncbi:MAG TPA: hypothetical protein VN513_13480 [Gemmatimonadales bacterium]|jgi:hypothetical protein|nr:hypothetical protein [Gemmatimonadales bacterium]
MPLLLVLMALFAPRIAIALLWVLSTWFDGLFTSSLWPVLGFVFLPTTLLWYTVVLHWFGGVWSPWTIVGLIIALIIDVSPASEHRRFVGRRAGDVVI